MATLQRSQKKQPAPAWPACRQALPYKDAFSGVGLDSSEAGFPPRLLAGVFRRAAELGWRRVAHAGQWLSWWAAECIERRCAHHAITSNSALAVREGSCPWPWLRFTAQHLPSHAGEEAGPDYIRSAIEDLGAERIDHGIHCLDDPQASCDSVLVEPFD